MSTTLAEPLPCVAAGDMGGATHCSDSASSRIPVLLANGQLLEAEELLKQAVLAGLIARETAAQWQEHIERAKERKETESRRPPPPISTEKLEPDEPSHRTCWTAFPNHPTCQALPKEYHFHSHRQALEALKERLGTKNLSLHKPFEAQNGPCPQLGLHYNVRKDGKRAGSITCCQCCVESTSGPLEWTKCRIVW